MKNRKQKLHDYDENYGSYLNIKNDELKLIEKYFADNKLDLESALEKGRDRAIKILNKRKHKTLKITLYEEPFKTERPRVGFYKNIYSPNASDNHKYMSENLNTLSTNIEGLLDILHNKINTPAEITIDAYFPVPKVKKKHAYEILLYVTGVLKVCRDPDYDNIGKAYTDMLNSTVVLDDRIFYKGVINKKYAILPRVDIIVKYQEKHDSIVIYESLLTTKVVKQLISENLITLEYLE